MRAGAIMAGAAAALTLVVAPSVASAQAAPRSRAPTVSVTEAQAAQSAAARTAPQRRGLRLDDSGRWGVDFAVSPPESRESRFGDVEAGAYYRVTPRLQVGASAGLTESEADPARPAQSERRAAPRFRLESIFRF